MWISQGWTLYLSCISKHKSIEPRKKKLITFHWILVVFFGDPYKLLEALYTMGRMSSPIIPNQPGFFCSLLHWNMNPFFANFRHFSSSPPWKLWPRSRPRSSLVGFGCEFLRKKQRFQTKDTYIIIQAYNIYIYIQRNVICKNVYLYIYI